MTRAAVYVRISKDAEGRALGVERQEKDARALAERRGWEVLDVYQDNDITASGKKKRPAWERLLQDLESGIVEAVVAYSSSRMYRRPADLQRLIKLTKERGVEIDTVTSGRIDLSTVQGRMLAGILAEVDQAELDTLIERTRRKMAELSAEGKRWGGKRPFGYTREMNVDPWEMNAIRQGVRMVLSGAPVGRVVARWNDDGIPTSTGNRWASWRVRQVLSSALIAGLREHHSDGKLVGIVPGTWQAIITKEEHQALRALLARKGHKGPSARKHPLTGILRCGECGSVLQGRTSAGRRSYGCSQSQGGRGCVAISANAAEDYVLDAVQAADPLYLKKRQARPPRTVDVDALVALGDAERRRVVLEQASLMGVDISTALATLEVEVAALNERVQPGAQVGADPEKDDPERRNRRHRGELTESEVLQTADWVREFVKEARVRRAHNTREAATERITVEWRTTT